MLYKKQLLQYYSHVAHVLSSDKYAAYFNIFGIMLNVTVIILAQHKV